MGQAIGGDQDDWALAELGIPSVTTEVGFVGQFKDEWQVIDTQTASDILKDQSQWLQYLYDKLPEIADKVDELI